MRPNKSMPTGSCACNGIMAKRWACWPRTSAISGSSRLARVTRNGDAGRAAVKLLLITLAQGSIYARCMSCCRLTVSSTSVVSALIGRLGYRVAGGG